ncbi:MULTISPECIES: LytS family sensor histidine kinase [Sphingobacterium]|uniref:Histidine kinase n=1 Tax=Sphingobacterium multivorum TaxID=28454 RepID=A0A2X2JK19_SPHMU|nr:MULTISPECIES: hypothetical protein [Sphingobacterium]QRQ60027.1 hypothetical protein I6J33_17960 [Sphingobacterium multivorum]SPZ92103.1 Uncharacterised protein [Sphingobacterium multivorum]
MIKQSLLKPLSRRVHFAFWTIYFIWISAVNIYKYGWGHTYVLFVLCPIMLSISYLNRGWLRQLLFRKIEVLQVSKLLSYFLVTAFCVYLALYEFPTELSRKILKNPQFFKLADFAIDIITFYLTFALKGGLILIMEILYNVTVSIFIYLGLVRSNFREATKVKVFRNWITHFMGNLTQSFARSVRKNPSNFTHVDSLLKIEGYALRQLNFRNDILGNLQDEIKYLRLLMVLYDEKNIKLQLDIENINRRIIPMMLMSLYKNMVKHGDFSQSNILAIISVSTFEDKLEIKCKNKISEKSAWIYGEGGTGLKQLQTLLRLEYGKAFTLLEKINEGMYYLNIEIDFNYENDKEGVKAGE